MGGKHSTFKLGPGAKTYWQHDAEWQPSGLISVFDNGSTPPKEKQSRGVLLKPDYGAKTVALAKAYVNPGKTLLAPAQGNTLSLTGGDWLMGYGNLPNFTEYDSAGHVLLDGTLGHNVQDFRTFLAPWSAQPETLARDRCEAKRRQRGGEHELERSDRRGLLADLRWLLPHPAGAGYEHAQERLSEHRNGSHERLLPGGPCPRREWERVGHLCPSSRRLSTDHTTRTTMSGHMTVAWPVPS